MSVCFIAWAIAGFGQDLTVTGLVTSAEDGQGIPGASILIKGTLKGTISDYRGAYNLADLKSTDTIVFRYLGFVEEQRVVGAQAVINVALKPEAQNLDEVVV